MGIFFVSFATFLFEIILTRVGANTLWYHYTHVIIFLTMIGFGIGAHFSLRLEAFPNLIKNIPNLLAVLFPLSLFIHINVFHTWSALAFFLVLIEVIVFALCFFLSGAFISHNLTKNLESVHKTYFFDLLGSGLGCLTAGLLLFYYWGTSLVFLCSTACLCASLWIWPEAKKKFAAFGLILLSLYFFHFNDKLNFLNIHYSKDITGKSFQTREEGKVYESWTPLSRVTVIDKKSFNDKNLIILSDAGAAADLIKFDGNISSLEREGYCRSNLHYYQRHFEGETLIIGSGGGSYVLCALENRKQKITAVEINPGIVEIVTHQFANYIGNIFSRPEVELHEEDGRNFIEKSSKLYDVIDISLTASWIGGIGGTYMFQENNLYTIQAFKSYLSHLTPTGTLIVTRFLDWGESLRVANSILEAASEMNIPDIEKKILIIRNNDEKARRATVFFKLDGFQFHEITDIDNLYQGPTNLKRLYPVVAADHLQAPNHDLHFSQLVENFRIGKNQQFVDNILQKYGFDINAVSDDKPFFFFTEGFRSVFHFAKSRNHPARHLALLILFIISAGLPFILVPYIVMLKSKKNIDLEHAFYFGLIGAAFMLIEVPLLQVYEPILGGQLYSMVAVLSLLMFFSGLGSRISHYFSSYHLQIKILPLLLLVSAGIIFATKAFQFQITSRPSIEKIFIIVLNLASLGIAIGGFYPLGIRLFKIQKENANYYWSLNCFWSAWASSAAMMLSIYFGYSAAILAGFLAYLFMSFKLMRSAA